MTSALAVAEGVFASLPIDYTAFAPFTTPKHTPFTKKKKEIHEWDTYFKIYTGLDHGGLSEAGGDLPDVQSK